MTLRKIIARNTRRIRQDLELTLEDMENRTKLSAQYLNRLERSENVNITADNLEKVAKGLGVDVSELVASVAVTSGSSDRLRKDLDAAVKLLNRVRSRIK